MNNRVLSICLVATMIVSCSIHEMEQKDACVTANQVFFARMEEPTRVYVDDYLRVLWHSNDHVSIFNKYTFNQDYRFTGQDGDNSGTFQKMPNDDFVTGNALDLVYAVYPYNESTKIDNDGCISIVLPAEQSYRENSFGPGANTMISATEDNQLLFKNLCGYLAIYLYGDNVAVKSISLRGNNGELLAGEASVSASIEDPPSMSFEMDSAKEISLVFDTPKKIGATPENATSFWVVVPPTTFSNGFTLTVKDNKNGVFTKSTTSSLEIHRNTLSRMAPLQATPKPSEDNIVFADHKVKERVVAAFDTNHDGEISYTEAAAVTSIAGLFDGIKTIESFDEFQYFTGVTTIPDRFFARMTILSSIVLPESIRSIGNYAFTECSSLKSIHFPQSVTGIGSRAFEKCTSLESVTFSDNSKITSLTGYSSYDIDGRDSLFGGLFAYCNALTRFVIPASVTSLGSRMFYGCTSLKEIVFEEGSKMTTIYGNTWNSVGGPFNGCSSVETIVLPETITQIGHAAFSYCTSLKSVNLTDGIKSISASAFAGCYNLEGDFAFPNCESIGVDAFGSCSKIHSISLGDNCTIVGSSAFRGCSGLESVSLSFAQTRIENSTFENCSSLKSIILPSHLAVIGGSAFSGCQNLSSIVIPEEVVEIQGSAFYNCKNLYSINIPNKVRTIGSSAFYRCTGLLSITIPESVTTIESAAFYGCTGLLSVTDKAINPPAMPYGYAFTDTNDCPIYVPSSSVDAYKEADGWSEYSDRIQAISE